jgi:hypothetical protein
MNNDQKQTWPTTEELEEAQAEQNQIKNVYQKEHQNIKLLGFYPMMKKIKIHIQNKKFFF